MGLFGSLKDAFGGQKIELDNDKKTCLLTKQAVKKDDLKVGAEINVEDGYDVVVCHIDTVCDCLPAGKHKFSDIDMPKLYKCIKPQKTKKGYVSPKSIQADVYYVNKANIENLPFKSPRSFKALYNSKKVRIKLVGTYNARVINSYLFVNTLLMDYSVIKDKTAKLELGDYVGYAMLEVLDKNMFATSEFSSNSELVLTKLKERVSKSLSSIGVEISDIKIEKVILPRALRGTQPIAETDNRIDDIYSTVYGSPIDNNKSEKETEKETAEKREVLAGNIKEDSGREASVSSGVINLGYGGFSASSSASQTPQETNSTLEEYEKATESFARLNSIKKQNLVFIGEEEKEKKQETSQKSENDIMLGRGKIPTIDKVERVDIEDDFVQRQRKLDIQHLKESLDDKIDRPKVMKDKNVCKYCSAKLSAKDTHCPQCGRSTKNIKYCKACGEENDGNDTICKMCGSKL